MSNNLIESNGAEAIAGTLRENEALQMLNLGNCGIGDLGVSHIRNAFAEGGNKTLEGLNLSDNRITSEGAKYIADILGLSESLEVLNLMNNQSIGVMGAQSIANGLKESKALEELDLSLCSIGDEGVGYIADALQGKDRLEDVSRENVRGNDVLRTLLLKGNHIGNEGAEKIAEALQHNEALEILDLSNNEIGDEGAKIIAKALHGNEKIYILNLSGNVIGIEGVKEIVRALPKGKGEKKRLYLSGNTIKDEEQETLRKMGCLICYNDEFKNEDAEIPECIECIIYL